MVNYTDMLAAYGIASAHPGGKISTKKVLSEYPIKHHSNVLEVGCGIGDTSKTIVQQYNSQVIAVDAHEKMIRKAKQRHRHIQNITFVQKDISEAHFENETFEAIICESVLSFTSSKEVLQLFKNWIKRTGTLYLLEPVYHGGLSPSQLNEYKTFYDFSTLNTKQDWISLIESCGFTLLRTYESTELFSDEEEKTIPEMMFDEEITADLEKVMEQHLSFNESKLAFFDYVYAVCKKI
ncbi:class I SAM-dependent methyltransferase [Evansella halocellulosilytica]|uniref:class I SAM-dependent methyltransferase n=1 Tax=Evansella halocellulosilytica TaxID=2011013 RepID=UPI0015CB39D1|nr:class I SAM-dependent methyltransferase [Evansella halocellulosilytica]